jgi:hypothetical protein
MKKLYTVGIFLASFFLLTSCSKDVKAPQKVASTKTITTTSNVNSQTTTTTSQDQTQSRCGHPCGGPCGGSSSSNGNGY